ncbi:hypothetical protein [Magnetofaba australis]|uniref:Uncharacterized protein n=1 Tax=Magnetofaba australis IT-1 TaxID=1434232 RepID=A0A1Y2K3K5_9PROT|nr:hypothetical protein [Magnetofaba australis]OSM03965.1 hypothetical protein MAIT1_03789 [Magnetofaba australis IT-1]
MSSFYSPWLREEPAPVSRANDRIDPELADAYHDNYPDHFERQNNISPDTMGQLRQEYEAQRINHYVNEENGSYRDPKAAKMAAIWDWNMGGGRKETALRHASQMRLMAQNAVSEQSAAPSGQGFAPPAQPPLGQGGNGAPQFQAISP